MSDTRKLKRGWYALVRCKDLAAEGLGVAHIEPDFFPWPVKPLTGFILGLLPGEEAIVRIENVRSGHFHGVLAFNKELEEDLHKRFSTQHELYALRNASPERVKAACENYLICGGCKLLNLSYNDTLEYKKKWFENQLRREKVEINDIQTIAASKTFHYRNHVQIHINGRKERGFFGPFSYRTQKFPEHGCLIFNNERSDREFPEELSLERCVRIRYDAHTDTVAHWSFNSKADKAGKFTYSIAWPPGSVTSVTIPNSSFFQVNLDMLPVWLNLIESHLLAAGLSKIKNYKILELFCGSGFISKMMSYRHSFRVLGIDILKKEDFTAVSWKNDQHGVPQITTQFEDDYISWDLQNWQNLPQQVRQKISVFAPNLLLLNPPRGGFNAAGLNDILGLPNSPQYVIYSSCNGATLARDLKSIVENGYTIRSTNLLDFFPWTSHYEIVVFAEKK